MTHFAANKDELSLEAVHCRALGHSWVPYTAPQVESRAFHGYNVTLVCDSCRTMKHFMLSIRGEYYPATYTYSDGYLLAKGNPWITREDKGQFKLEALGLDTTNTASVTDISKRYRA